MSISRSTVAVAAIALLFGSTGGAVAGGMVTGAQIKNGSVTGKDIKDKSLATKDLSPSAIAALAGTDGSQGPAGADGVSGYEVIAASTNVTANSADSVSADCSPGKKVIGMTGFWDNNSAAVQTAFSTDLEGGVAYTTGIGSDDLLVVKIVCAVVD